jgi:hypothetical protein
MKYNNVVNADEFFVRCVHYKCAGYGWRSKIELQTQSWEILSRQARASEGIWGRRISSMKEFAAQI